jgi:peptide/nickel transport system permease protein
VAGIILIMFYVSSAFAGFFAPYNVDTTHSKYANVPPIAPRLIGREGNVNWPPFVYGYNCRFDAETFQWVTECTWEKYDLQFFVRGDEYEFLGLFPTDIHFFGVEEPGRIFLMGTDPLGRDLFSRILHGGRVSLTVGVVGVLLSLTIGSVVGSMAGYFGGAFDNISMRIIEVLMAFPQIPLWLALASALPANLDSLKVYFGITVVLSIINWGRLARQLRAKVLALRDSDFVIAARVVNCRNRRVILRHLLPNTFSHVIVVATLSIPGTILGETALSFLGLGIRPPMTSWGLLLSDAQATRVLLQQPWLLWPIAPVMITALCFNLLGDGIRDAVDPYAV